ncbi:MAG: HmuY family protein [Myxococcota bacterium]
MLKTELGWLVAALAVVAVGCASDLSERLEGQEAQLEAPELLTVEDQGDATWVRVDASSSNEWVHMRFSEMVASLGTEPGEVGGAWDLAFQRFKVRVNGGASGTAGVEVAVLTDVAFDALVEAPSTGYAQDAPDENGDGEVEPVFEMVSEGWYVYDFATHTLSPRSLVYVLKTFDEQFFKLEFLDYYDDAGSSGHPSFRLAPLSPPA